MDIRQHEVDVLPVLPALRGLLPAGGLRPGSVTTVRDASLLLALLAGPSAAGGWTALVGMPEYGMLAASELGVVSERLLLVDAPGARWAEVVAALLDGVQLVAVRPGGQPPGVPVTSSGRAPAAGNGGQPPTAPVKGSDRAPAAGNGGQPPTAPVTSSDRTPAAGTSGPTSTAPVTGSDRAPAAGTSGPTSTAPVTSSDRTPAAGTGGQPSPAVVRRLTAVARRHDAALVVPGVWAGADLDLEVTATYWRGVHDGHGRLRERLVEVVASGRGSAGRPRTARLVLPAADGGVHLAPETPLTLAPPVVEEAIA